MFGYVFCERRHKGFGGYIVSRLKCEHHSKPNREKKINHEKEGKCWQNKLFCNFYVGRSEST
jgi:hypothetical protein